MRTFDYIEDYIEFIAGYRELNGTKLSMWNGKPSPISLARYDVGIVESFAHQLDDNKAFTDKQADLAKKIVLKYRKQLLSLEVEIPEPTPGYRLGIREVDRVRRIYIDNDKLYIKFPYETELISLMRTHVKESQGSVTFIQGEKIWQLGLTESNINFVATVGAAHQFEVDPAVANLFEQIVESEKMPYAIELIKTDTGFDITNCPESLRSYVNDSLGGFDSGNLITLVDQSSVLGYTVSTEILNQLVHEHGEQFTEWLVSRQITANKDLVSIDMILDYAQKVKRDTVYVYDTSLTTSEKRDGVYYLNRSTPDFVTPKILITMSDMMIGSRKQLWVTTAEKVFFLK